MTVEFTGPLMAICTPTGRRAHAARALLEDGVRVGYVALCGQRFPARAAVLGRFDALDEDVITCGRCDA